MIKTKKLIPECWLTAKCWSSTLKNWHFEILWPNKLFNIQKHRIKSNLSIFLSIQFPKNHQITRILNPHFEPLFLLSNKSSNHQPLTVFDTGLTSLSAFQMAIRIQIQDQHGITSDSSQLGGWNLPQDLSGILTSCFLSWWKNWWSHNY